MDYAPRSECTAVKRMLTEDVQDEADSVEVPKPKKAKYEGKTEEKQAPKYRMIAPPKMEAKLKKAVDEEELALRVALRVVDRRGPHQAFVEMPEDIICEIFSSLEPIDLLCLARTSKVLRSFLMSRRSEYIWRAAREGMDGLPPPPTGSSEPAYASFLLDTHCQKCETSETDYTDWVSRIRLCARCAFDGTMYTFHPDLRSVRHARLLCHNIPRLMGSSHTNYLSITDLLNVRVCDSLQKEAARIKGENEWRKFVLRWCADQRAAQVEAQKIQMYVEHRAGLKHIPKNVKTSLRKQRFVAIIERLKAKGWSAYLSKEVCELLEKHVAVNQPRALTDRIWKNIEPSLIDFMEIVKSKCFSDLDTVDQA
ncbi:hypothetical protein CYLTODRAFT_490456 [Cylindrobasidium torrendii FP15055 ss-10]|uniref:F-box domain-containing protein n=1 Tax=Cylindrobasidium torrendii FP15055 ss-10 TaxID=1314674 RepID=A0A0D7BBJ5_9AGAR|nr:hypothetical protein CYLTODRAFT_490456 [Cylindrobasidium torrendii FP15055 ss-10]